MRLSCNVLLSLLLLVVAPARAAEPWVIRFDGVGPLRFGMRFDEVNARLGHRLKRTPAGQLASEGCDQIGLAGIGHKGMALMFVDDIFRRVDVVSGARTAAGVAPGDAIGRVYAVYANVATAPRPYQAESEVSLTVQERDGRHAIRFESMEGVVEVIYAGDQKQVEWIEGCL